MDDVPVSPAATGVAPATPSFLSHARLIAAITLGSRVLGLARESVAAHYFGAGAVWSAFQYAFTIPNLFRKLLGEGALSTAFIPLYAQSVKHDRAQAASFASASVNFLAAVLVAVTIAVELFLLLIARTVELRPTSMLALQLTALMLPYVMLVCGAAFLSGILQVHRRFGWAAATSIVSNLFMIAAIVLAARRHDLRTPEGQQAGVWWIATAVLLSGAAQIAILLPSLRAAGFRFTFLGSLWTPMVRRMVRNSVPVVLSAGVLQIGVLLDRQIAFSLSAETGGAARFSVFGYDLPYPMQEGAVARLNWAQFLYQFPLGVFAIALATAIFPQLSDEALGADRTRFKQVLRRGVEAAMFLGVPASAGMIIVARPAVALLFEGGEFGPSDTRWVALSTAIYSSAIWAFSLQHIVSRGYYALHDMTTPLIWTGINLLLNLVVELPLVWTDLGESGMAAGTLVSFAAQSLAMLWLLDRRLGGIGLRPSVRPLATILLATGAMTLACELLKRSPLYPEGAGKLVWAGQLALLMGTGTLVYFGLCAAMGLPMRLRR